MPTGFLRFVAVALLALTVPVQGMAAVAAGQCMVLGHHQDRGGDSSHDHGQHGASQHGADEHVHADDHGAVPHDDDTGKQSHCGPCTACCASASIAGTAALPIPPALAYAKYAFLQLPPRGVQPHGLDRPPLAL